MARGFHKHLKRINAPKTWMLSKLGGVWAPRPSNGPHKLRECLPLSLILRNRLKLSLTRRETLQCVMRRFVKVDGKIRTDLNFPAGFGDVVSIEKAGKAFRLSYDTKGRFVLQKVAGDEAKFKLCRVQKVARASKAAMNSNPLLNGQAAAIPYIATHDGRTIRFADPAIKVNDTVKVDLATGKVIGHFKFEVGNVVMCIRGHNIGRVGVITHVDRHPGGFDIVQVKDKRNQAFSTRYVLLSSLSSYSLLFVNIVVIIIMLMAIGLLYMGRSYQMDKSEMKCLVSISMMNIML